MDVTINIDAGGTFTDGVFTYGDVIETAKVPTTEHDLTVCFVDCIERGAEKLETSVPELFSATDVIRFSTTAGTNTVIEKTGPKMGLLVTEGHEEGLYADGEKTVTEGFVEPGMVEGVEETVTPDGTVEVEPDPEEVSAAVKGLQENGARLIVIALRNAYANDANERRVKEIIEDAYPPHYLGALPTLASFEVSARPNDYRRLNTVALNAYIHRPMKSTLYKAEDRARDRGYARPLFIGHSNGGMSHVAKTIAINTHNSGPAAGVLGVQALSELYGEDMVAADMGGTSIDISVVRDGEFSLQLSPRIDGLETSIPAIETNNLGAGGGSIAVVEDGDLRVGPESAGANPGPACFGRGGRNATVTDADLVRGVLNPEYFLGGRYELSPERGREAIAERVADPLGVSEEEAATRVADAVQANVGGGISRWAEGVGTVVAFGGAGAVHAAGFAEAAGADRVLITPYSSVFSAFGESTMDVDHTYSEYVGRVTADAVAAGLEALNAEARRDMRSEGFDPDEIGFGADLLVESGDGYEVHPLTYRPGEGVGDVPSVAGDACVRLHAVGEVSKFAFDAEELEGTDPSGARKDGRDVFWGDEYVTTPTYRREDLRPGNVVSGPAVIEAIDTTIGVPPGREFEVDRYGHGVMEL